MTPVVSTTNKSSPTVVGGEPAVTASERNAAFRKRYLSIEAEMEELDDDDPRFGTLATDLGAIASEFIETNTALAVMIVRRWCTNPTDYEDLYQEGLTTLWEYFTSWDPARASYATYVMASLEGDVRRLNVKLSGAESYYDRLARGDLVHVIQTLTDGLGRQPSNHEVAAAMGVSRDRVARMRRPRSVSLDAPLSSEGGTRAEMLETSTFDTSALGGDDVEVQWVTALASATEQLNIADTVLLLRRDGLDGWAPETLAQLASLTGHGREVLRRAEAGARAAIAARGHALPLLL